MSYPLYNNSELDMEAVQHLFDSFLPFAEKYLGISKCPAINLVSDRKNAQLPLGKTGFYDPGKQKITIFTDNRHIKDILRSLSHELVHHKQNLQGMFDGAGPAEPGYAQSNQHLRDMEREAYEKGNLCLRDWEDKYKKQLQESIYTIKGDNSKMSYKNWRNQEVNDRLMESWGLKAPKSEILTESIQEAAPEPAAKDNPVADVERVVKIIAKAPGIDRALTAINMRQELEGALNFFISSVEDSGTPSPQDVILALNNVIRRRQEGVEESTDIDEGLKGLATGTGKYAGKALGGLGGAIAGIPLGPAGIVGGALAGQKLGGVAGEKGTEFVIDEKEVEEGGDVQRIVSLLSKSPGMEAALAAINMRQELEGALELLVKKVEDSGTPSPQDVVLALKNVRRSRMDQREPEAAEGPAMKKGPASIPVQESVQEQQVRKTIREAITKALKRRSEG